MIPLMVNLKESDICSYCGKRVHYKTTTMEEHQLHLCRTCKHTYPECKSLVKFGNCIGNDNIVDCDAYAKR